MDMFFTDLGQDENPDGCANCAEKDMLLKILHQQLNDKPLVMGPKRSYLKVLSGHLLKNLSASFMTFFEGITQMYEMYYNEERRQIEAKPFEDALQQDAFDVGSWDYGDEPGQGDFHDIMLENGWRYCEDHDEYFLQVCGECGGVLKEQPLELKPELDWESLVKDWNEAHEG